jgi:hypothetical protein
MKNMKSRNLLSVVIAALLLVTAVSCTSTRDIYQEEEGYRTSRQTPDRILVDDPYYGTIVMERDPYTGRYYQVGSYGSSYGYDRYSRNSGYYRNTPRRQQVIYQRDDRPVQTPQQKEASRQEARKKVLGK